MTGDAAVRRGRSLRDRWTLAWLGTGAVGLAAFVAFRTLMPDGPSNCLLLNLASIPCPGCGMTRASALLARGDLPGSVSVHPMALVFAIQMLVAWAWWGLVLAGRARPPSPWWGIVPLSLDIAALAGLWILRYHQGSLPG